MATIMTHPSTRIDPPVYGSNNPTHCLTCDDQHDEDDGLDVTYSYVDGDPYCLHAEHGHHSCYSAAKNAAYRKELSAQLSETLALALRQIRALDRTYPDACEHTLDEMFEDCAHRVDLFAAGKDTGWENGLMLAHSEATKLRYALEDVSSLHLVNVRSRLSLIPQGIKPYLFEAQRDGEILATVGRQLLVLQVAEQRTLEGCAA